MVFSCYIEIYFFEFTTRLWHASCFTEVMANSRIDDNQSVSPVRILLVDDYEPFRRFVCSILGKRPELQVVGEASDGLEAVHKAEELRPDLIVLDIGLPILNGLEAARRIRKLTPRSKILIVSQESSSDVVEEALNSGALGYVAKTRAGTELLAAVEVVCKGIHFVGSDLRPFVITEISGEHLGDSTGPQGEILASPFSFSHEVAFYADDASFVDDFTRFIESTLNGGNIAIVMLTESHQSSILQRLQANGLDMAAAIRKGHYLSLDASDTLSRFMVDGCPDPVRVVKVVADLMEGMAKSAKAKRCRVAACGELAPTLWARGKGEAAIQLEHLWDEIAKKYDVATLCGYVLKTFQREQESHVYERICAEHSAVYSQ
jgi:DNA-binding NarL/FixJ family response regulator